MKRNKEKLIELNTQLQYLEEKLQNTYYKLGKKTQELVELNSNGINSLVNEIIEVKKEIFKLENENVKG